MHPNIENSDPNIAFRSRENNKMKLRRQNRVKENNLPFKVNTYFKVKPIEKGVPVI